MELSVHLLSDEGHKCLEQRWLFNGGSMALHLPLNLPFNT